MESYIFKLLAANVTLISFLFCDVFIEFSLYKLCCVAIGAVILPICTFFGKKVIFGISGKLPYIVTIYMLTKIGMWLVEEQTFTLSFFTKMSLNYDGIILVVIAIVVLAFAARFFSKHAFKHEWFFRLLFYYITLLLFVFGISRFFGVHSFVSWFYFSICGFFFACSVFFKIITNLRLGENDNTYKDRSGLMAVLMCLVLLALFIFKYNAFYSAGELIEYVFGSQVMFTWGIRSVVRIVTLLLLALCCFFTDYLLLVGKIKQSQAEIACYSDTYVVLSFCGVYAIGCSYSGKPYSIFVVCSTLLFMMLLCFLSAMIKGTDDAACSKKSTALIVGLAVLVILTVCAVLQIIGQAEFYGGAVIALTCIIIVNVVLSFKKLRRSSGCLFWILGLLVPAVYALFVLYISRSFSTMLMVASLYIIFIISICSFGIGGERARYRKAGMIIRLIEYCSFCVLMTLLTGITA
jgi:hypothetical protein